MEKVIFTKIDSTPSEREVAYHEAGHAIMAYLCKRPIEYISIKPENRVIAFTTMQQAPYQEAMAWPLIGWGAYFSQTLLSQSSSTGMNWNSYGASSKDFEQGIDEVRLLMQQGFQPEDLTKHAVHIEMWVHGFWCQAGMFTEMLMSRPMVEQGVRALAELLLEKKHISIVEMNELLEPILDRDYFCDIIMQFVDGYTQSITEYFAALPD